MCYCNCRYEYPDGAGCKKPGWASCKLVDDSENDKNADTYLDNLGDMLYHERIDRELEETD